MPRPLVTLPWYEVRDLKFHSFEAAAARAVECAVQSGDTEVLVEHRGESDRYVTVQATTEEINLEPPRRRKKS